MADVLNRHDSRQFTGRGALERNLAHWSDVYTEIFR